MKSSGHQNESAQPPCAKWGVWVGPEVEGEVGRGERTLFVRSNLPAAQVVHLLSSYSCTRLWLCDGLVRNHGIDPVIICAHVKQACPKTVIAAELIANPAKEHMQHATEVARCLKELYGVQLYIKLHDFDFLDANDHICLGAPYKDRVFRIPANVLPPMKPEDYMGDTEIQI